MQVQESQLTHSDMATSWIVLVISCRTFTQITMEDCLNIFRESCTAQRYITFLFSFLKCNLVSIKRWKNEDCNPIFGNLCLFLVKHLQHPFLQQLYLFFSTKKNHYPAYCLYKISSKFKIETKLSLDKVNWHMFKYFLCGRPQVLVWGRVS